MEKILGNYLVEVPKDSNEPLELNVGDIVVLGSQSLYEIVGFSYYDNMIFFKGKDKDTGALGVFRPRSVKKFIKLINWKDEYPRLLRELPFDIDTLDVVKLHKDLTFNLFDGIRLTICVDVDDNVTNSDELFRGSYRTQNTQQDIDFIISQR